MPHDTGHVDAHGVSQSPRPCYHLYRGNLSAAPRARDDRDVRWYLPAAAAGSWTSQSPPLFSSFLIVAQPASSLPPLAYRAVLPPLAARASVTVWLYRSLLACSSAVSLFDSFGEKLYHCTTCLQFTDHASACVQGCGPASSVPGHPQHRGAQPRTAISGHRRGAGAPYPQHPHQPPEVRANVTSS